MALPPFKDLSEVNMFIWEWIRGFGSAVFDYLLVGTRKGLFDVYNASASLTNQIFSAQKKWYKQVITLLTAIWRDTAKKTTSATRSALGQLDGISQDVTRPHISVTDRILLAGVDVVRLLTAPLRTVLTDLVFRIRDLWPISNAISEATEAEIYGAETRSAGAFQATADWTDELASFHNAVLDKDGLYQPGRLLTSVAAYATSVLAVFINGGVPDDPAPQFQALQAKYPLPTVRELEEEIVSGELPYRPSITAALELIA